MMMILLFLVLLPIERINDDTDGTNISEGK